MVTWIVKVLDDKGQDYYMHYREEPTGDDYQKLEAQGYKAVGIGKTVIEVIR